MTRGPLRRVRTRGGSGPAHRGRHRRHPPHLLRPDRQRAGTGPAGAALPAHRRGRCGVLPVRLRHHTDGRRGGHGRWSQRRTSGHRRLPGSRDLPAGAVGAGRGQRHRRPFQPRRQPVRGEPPRGATPGRRQVRRARHAPLRRARARVLPARPGRGRARRLAPVRRRHRQRLRLRPARRPGKHPARRATDAREVRPGRRGRQPRVLRRPVRDQPVALRCDDRRGPRVPVQVGHQGARPPSGQAGHLHGETVQRRGRFGLPPPLLHLERRRQAAVRRS